ncbi:hypothetical protein LP417_17420 [Polaromonas sp. P1-6]|nr:hypothetical protein LP417_17420 [Polaromonas sp. P1-6]
MNTHLDNLDRLRLHDLARRRAQVLRREAITDFWRGADAVLAATLGGAHRSAQRLVDSLVQRLARHERGRSASTSTLASGD